MDLQAQTKFLRKGTFSHLSLIFSTIPATEPQVLDKSLLGWKVLPSNSTCGSALMDMCEALWHGGSLVRREDECAWSQVDLGVPELQNDKKTCENNHLFSKCLRRTYHVPGSELGARDIQREETGSLPSGSSLSQRGGRHHSRRGSNRNKMVTGVDVTKGLVLRDSDVVRKINQGTLPWHMGK